MPCGAIAEIVPGLSAALGDRFTSWADVRRHYGPARWWNVPVAPEAVPFPASTDEVARLVRSARPGGCR